MAFVPVIIHVPTTRRQLDCITQDGKRYCEKEDFTAHEAGLVCLVFLLVFAYIGGIFFALETVNKFIILTAIFVPLIIGAVWGLSQ